MFRFTKLAIILFIIKSPLYDIVNLSSNFSLLFKIILLFKNGLVDDIMGIELCGSSILASNRIELSSNIIYILKLNKQYNFYINTIIFNYKWLRFIRKPFYHIFRTLWKILPRFAYINSF